MTNTEYDRNPYVSPALAESPSARPEPQSFRAALWQGARLGVKWITIIFGPFIALGLLAGMAIFYRKENFSPMSPEFVRSLCGMIEDSVGAYLVFCLWGVVAGELVCVTRYCWRKYQRRRSDQQTNA